MTTKEKYELIDKTKVNEKILTILRNMEQSSSNFTNEAVNSKIDVALEKLIEQIRAVKPEALLTLPEAKKEVKKEKEKAIKKNKDKDLSEKKDTDDETGLPKKDTIEERKDIIKEESETEKEARDRAKKELEKENEKAKDEVESQIEKLNRLILEDPALQGFNTGSAATGGGRSTPIIDAERKALPRGSRVSQKGWMNQYGASNGGRKYWENRENRSDRKSPEYETGKPYLKKGGNIDSVDERMNLVIAYNYAKDRRVDSDKSFEEFKEEFKRKTPKSAKYSDKVMKATYYALQQNYAKGGEVEGVDLFEDYDDQPEEVQAILANYEMEDNDYETLQNLKAELESIGYTMDFGLDAEPYDLRKIGQTGKSEFYAKGGKLNTEVILTENRSNGAKWRGVVKPFMMKSIERNQYAGGFKRYEIDIYDDVEREPSKEELKQANEFFDKVGGRFAKGGMMADDGELEDEISKIKSLGGDWQSYYKGAMAGKKDDGYVTIEDEADLNNYIYDKTGYIVKNIEVIEKGKNYPLNNSNPYSEDTYLVTLKNGTNFTFKRSYGRPIWQGNVNYIERIKITNINTKHAKGGMMADGGKIELYYVKDSNGYVKNISKTYEDANKFLEKGLKYNGNIGYALVPKDDWENEKVTVANIKRYAGMMADGGETEDYYENLAIYVRGLGEIYRGNSMKEALAVANNYKRKNIKAKIVVVDDKIGDEYDLDGNLTGIQQRWYLMYAKGGEMAKGGITPQLNEKVYAKAQEILKAEGITENISQKQFNQAYDKAIKEFGYSPAYFKKVMREFGPEYPDDDDTEFGDFMADGGEVSENYKKFGEDNSQLVNFDLSELDDYEEMQFNHALKSFSKAESLQVLINTVEGDYSQLNEGLAEIAEEQYPSEEFFENTREYAKGGEMARGGKTDGKYTEYEMVVLSKNADGKSHKYRFLISARNIDEAKQTATDGWHSEFGDMGETFYKVMTDSKYRKNYMTGDGGGVPYKPYGKTKGRFKLTYEIEGEPQSEIRQSLEEATDSAKRYSSPKLEYTNVHIYDESGKEYFFADGGMMEDDGELNGDLYKVGFIKVYEDGEEGDMVYVKEIYGNSEEEALSKFKKIHPKHKIEFISKYADGGMMADGGEMKLIGSKLKNQDNEIQVDGNKLKIQKKDDPINFLTITQVGKDLYNVDVTSGSIQSPSKSFNATWHNLYDKYHNYDELLKILNGYGLKKMANGGIMADGGETTKSGKVKNLEDAKKWVSDRIKYDKVSPHKKNVYHFLQSNMKAPKYPKVVATYFNDQKLDENIFIEPNYAKGGYMSDGGMMADGGEVDFIERMAKMRSAYENLNMIVKSKIAMAVGIDRAISIMENDYSIDPFSLIISAVRGGLLELDEINKDLVNEAVYEAENVTDDYRDSGQGISGSDMTTFTKNVLDSAGYKTGFINNRLERVDEEGNKLEIDKYNMNY